MKRKIKVKVPTVYVNGGLISGVEGFPANSPLDFIDYDIEGATKEDICNCHAGDGTHFHVRSVTDENGKW